MTAEIQAQLENAYYVWLTTVRADGMPQPTPVWFIWNKDTDTVVMFSEPASRS